MSDSATPWTVAARLLCPWDSPGKNTGVGSLNPLQGIFSTQGSNPGLLHCRRILYQLSYQGSPSFPCLYVNVPKFLILWLDIIITSVSFVLWQCCVEHWGAHVFINLQFFLGRGPREKVLNYMVSLS